MINNNQKPIPQYFVDFLDWLDIEKGLSSKSQENYARFIKKFFEWLKINNLEGIVPAQLTPEHVFKYKAFLSRQYRKNEGVPLKKTTQNYYLISLRSLLTYFADKDIASLPPEKIKLSKQTEKIVSFLNLEQVKKLLSMPDISNITGLRDRAILEMLFSTGLRVSELASLNREQIKIDKNNNELEIVIIGKGNRPRTVYISKRAVSWLKRYLESRKDKEKALFINYRGKARYNRLTTRSIERMVKKYVISAGLPLNTSPHTLRHSFATDLLSKGVDLRVVQEFLGHKNIVTTQIYTHVTRPQLKEIHKKYHGLAQEKNVA